MKRILTVLSLLAATAAVFAAAEIGKPAPDFTATDINGKTHKLTDYKGRIVVLDVIRHTLQFFDRTGPGPDHPVYSNCLESRYLKVLWSRVV